MAITTLSSRELNQNVTRAKKAAKSGPVFITDRGKPAHVLLSIEEYQRLTRQRRNIADSLGVVSQIIPPSFSHTDSGCRPMVFPDYALGWRIPGR
ncbi:Prevent-host-death family protein [Ectothiorhodospira sp. PHS-1]|uniref:type II toxin-antitoxin system Phd/YefM family antitoxin n=1 Tax=Ectothiorhodospira sp. PHS-1 TaxID=519989 RepID=UPI00024A8A0B|nr:type II toxin-antitoxin system Phd/YefM family antitoxin [Ectothiorhodospira sp. PHS-1]EHQ53682.1 Prevent-host-death family protein [Ectothiorhodospira sp. PHS-1]